MKTVLIERVRNGWIVRPFNTSSGIFDPGCRGDNEVSVYRTMHELQHDLPMLCEWETDKSAGA
jgi:hypothetical protein